MTKNIKHSQRLHEVAKKNMQSKLREREKHEWKGIIRAVCIAIFSVIAMLCFLYIAPNEVNIPAAMTMCFSFFGGGFIGYGVGWIIVAIWFDKNEKLIRFNVNLLKHEKIDSTNFEKNLDEVETKN